jgi:hypothetical protein
VSEPKETQDVYAIGSNVLLDGTISARITGITIRGKDRVYYEVVWWNDRERKELSGIENWEIRPDDEKTRTLRVNHIL